MGFHRLHRLDRSRQRPRGSDLVVKVQLIPGVNGLAFTEDFPLPVPLVVWVAHRELAAAFEAVQNDSPVFAVVEPGSGSPSAMLMMRARVTAAGFPRLSSRSASSASFRRPAGIDDRPEGGCLGWRGLMSRCSR